jgi:hypothetical protein
MRIVLGLIAVATLSACKEAPAAPKTSSAAGLVWSSLGAWQASSESLVYEHDARRSGIARTMDAFGDATVDVDVTHAAETLRIGIWFRMRTGDFRRDVNDWAKREGYELEYAPDGKAKILRWSEGAGTPILDLPRPLLVKAKNHVRVASKGARHVITWNGEIVAELTDATYPNGQIAFEVQVTGPPKGGQVAFSGIRIDR